MDPMAEEQLDYEDEEYGSSQKIQYHGGGAISALAEDEIIGEDDEYDDLYNDVNVGEGFLQLQQQQQQSESAPVTSLAESQSQTTNLPELKSEPMNTGLRFPEQNAERRPELAANVNVSTQAMVPEMTRDVQAVNSGFRGQIPVPQQVAVNVNPVMSGKAGNDSAGLLTSDSGGGPRQIPPNQMVNNVNVNDNHIRPPSVDTGATMLFVGELHWWTTDAEVESVLSQYGRVKEIKFFDERASGKSKGYCQVEFYESAAASACKEGMDGYVFNGRACVVAFASPLTIRQMGASYVNKSQVQPQTQPQGRKPFNDGGNGGGRGGGANFSGGGDGGGGRNFGEGGGGGGRNFGRGGWGRGGQGILNRGPGGNLPMRGRGGGAFGAKNMVGNAFGNPAFGGPPGGFMHPQGVMGTGFDPTYMGRGAGYGGFPGPAFPGLMPQFPGVNTMGLAGVAPHVNPAFFGRGMGSGAMGMMGSTGMEGHHAGMWGGDTSMGGGGWGGGGEEHGGGGGQRTRESSYGGEDGGSEYGYGGEVSNDKGGGGGRSKERVSEREWSGTSEKRLHREDREQEQRDRYESRDHHSSSSRYKEEKDYREHRQKERDFSYEDDYDRGHSSSRPRSRSRAVPEDSDHRSRSRDADYSKRRRLPSE